MASSTTLIIRQGLVLLLALGVSATPPAIPAEAGPGVAGGLADQVRQLARTEGFTVRGLDRLADAPASLAKGSSVQQVHILLGGFDYVIVHGPEGKVQRLIILGAKRPLPPSPVATAGKGGEILIRTRREGDHHLVSAVLVGNSGQRLPQELLIDTGASLTVLPLSRASALGLGPEQLATREMSTAKGPLQGWVGKIAALELGGARIPDLEVAFVDDSGLGGHALLGMNLLSRYLFILDDEHNELTLVPDKH